MGNGLKNMKIILNILKDTLDVFLCILALLGVLLYLVLFCFLIIFAAKLFIMWKIISGILVALGAIFLVSLGMGIIKYLDKK